MNNANFLRTTFVIEHLYWLLLVQPHYAYNFSDSTAFHAYKILNNIECIDLVSLLSYSVHAAQGDICFCFAEFSVYERPKMI